MKTLYAYFCKLEDVIVQVFLCMITFLVFISALLRTVKLPINWAQDLAMLFFAWTVFLGADMALRKTELVNVDLLLNRLSQKNRVFLYILFNIMILAFLASLVWFGIPLAIESQKRLFQTLEISYSWATVSVPIGSLLMMVSTVLKIKKAYIENLKK